MAVLDNLEPKQVFHFFEELCKIPHATFDTKRISDYCVALRKERPGGFPGRGKQCHHQKARNMPDMRTVSQ